AAGARLSLPRLGSFRLEETAGDPPAAPPLEGEARADVAIVGGGYVGLWTALSIKRLDPGCDVVVLEQDICGGGASGRNGGFVLGWWTKLPSLARLVGAEDAVAGARGARSAIGGNGDFCVAHGLRRRLPAGGWVVVAAAGCA